jgi:6-phosphogluconolactonase/glucosamine-6-phosphate isomerase/deaminase
MEHTIEKLKNPLVMIENGKTTITNGYAFIDKCGGCIILVYGEGRRDSMSKYLSGNTDELHLKYGIIDLTHM